MIDSRFQSFAEAYVLAVAEACRNLGMYREPRETVEQAALNTALVMLEQIKSKGIQAVESYVVNRFGGAFRATCAALGLADKNYSRALQTYLEGDAHAGEGQQRGGQYP